MDNFPLFNEDEGVKNLTASEVTSLVEVSCGNPLRSSCIQYNLSDFWLHVRKEYPEWASKVLKHLIVIHHNIFM
jgi:hypothetical protein